MPQKQIGILTAGGDAPGLNAAIRGIGKTAISHYDMQILGFQKGFRGVAQNQSLVLNGENLSGILTLGGTILGTSRDKPHKMAIGGKSMDMTDAIVETYRQLHLDCLLCLGGGGTQKNALHLKNAGLNVISLPKTIDNDVSGTEMTFGFDTALGIATEAIDRLHSTAHSHHRIIVAELMGHNAGWLTLGAGIAGGADVILIPEIPYTAESVAEAIKKRVQSGKRFSIVAVAEGALTQQQAMTVEILSNEIEVTTDKAQRKKLKSQLRQHEQVHINNTLNLSRQLEKLTGLESRTSILGHLQRGGTPSAGDRILATHLGAAAVDFINQEQYGIMVAYKNQQAVGVPLEEIAGIKKRVPPDHPWVQTARKVGTSLGD
ncbi:MAG: 6-phosphofructokinase [Proteobacteria bacterium]|nr:6-phosphofructokinase [Pseudomonadota bacterium]